MTEDMKIIEDWNTRNSKLEVTQEQVLHVENYQYFLMVHRGVSEQDAFKSALMVCSGMPSCCTSATNWKSIYWLKKCGAEFFRDEAEVAGRLYDMICAVPVTLTDPDDYSFLLSQVAHHDDAREYIFSGTYEREELHERHTMGALKKLYSAGMLTPVSCVVSVYLIYGRDVACGVTAHKKHGMEKVMRIVKGAHI